MGCPQHLAIGEWKRKTNFRGLVFETPCLTCDRLIDMPLELIERVGRAWSMGARF